MGVFHLIAENTSKTIDASAGGESWLLTDGAYLTVDGNAVDGGYGGEAGSGRLIRIDGHLFSTANGVVLGAGLATAGDIVELGQNGTINAAKTGVILHGEADSFINHGTITAKATGLDLGGKNSTALNAGTITSSGKSAIYVAGEDAVVQNAGILTGRIGIDVVGYGATILNSGSITSASDTPDDAAVRLGGGAATLVNSGFIYGAVTGSLLAEVIENFGTIVGSIRLAEGDDYYYTTGAFSENHIDLGSGNDTYVSAGNRIDKVTGGNGDDTFIIDSGRIRITEFSDGGTDQVVSSVGYKLGANVEKLELSGTEDIRGAGNKLDNMIVGNNGDNRLLGGSGNDTIDGKGGGDIIRGGAGLDTVTYISSDYGVSISLSGKPGIDGTAEGDQLYSIENLTGSMHADVLIGNGRQNRLEGLLGNDLLTGGGAKDVFVYSVYSTYDNYTDHDIIVDFENGTDRIEFKYAGQNYDTFSEIKSASHQAGANVVIEILLDGGSLIDHTLTILNFSMAKLDASDFIFA